MTARCFDIYYAAVHFVGFRTDAQYSAAVRVFGKPDFIHSYHDHRSYGDIDFDNDLIVYGDKGNTYPDPLYSDQDCTRFQE